MFLKGLDLNLLVVLDVLLEEKSVTRAASRLYRSQPAISGMLARLREYFGDELLIRVGRSIEVTPFGLGLIAPLKDFLRTANEVVTTRPIQPLGQLEQTFTLVMSDYAAGILLPPLLSHVAKVAPLVKIRARGVVEDVAAVLQSGDADFVIYPAGLLPTGTGSQHRSEKILEDEWVCIGDASHFAQKAGLSVEEYSRQPLAVVRHDSGALPMVPERAFEDLGIGRSIKAYVPLFSLLPQLVEGSDRIAIMHRRSALAALQRYNIKILALPIVLPRLELDLCWHARHERSHSHMWLRTTIHDLCMGVDATEGGP